ncbi:MAG: hypothetical protein KAY59_06450, partial [Acidobacteria bacterium]|nr:hypothetical protein [Acidobacteriota bacterium]
MTFVPVSTLAMQSFCPRMMLFSMMTGCVVAIKTAARVASPAFEYVSLAQLPVNTFEPFAVIAAASIVIGAANTGAVRKPGAIGVRARISIANHQRHGVASDADELVDDSHIADEGQLLRERGVDR